jgi:hypothetical protein
MRGLALFWAMTLMVQPVIAGGFGEPVSEPGVEVAETETSAPDAPSAPEPSGDQTRNERPDQPELWPLLEGGRALQPER